MDLREIGWGCRVDSVDSGFRLVAGSCENGVEPSGCGTMELVSSPYLYITWEMNSGPIGGCCSET
jgi:hypothetical protein